MHTHEPHDHKQMFSPTLCEFAPYLSINDAQKMVAVCTDVFGVAPDVLLTMSDGRVIHCEFRIGNGRFFHSEELPEHGGMPSPTRLGGTSGTTHLCVDDCATMVESMKNNGSEALMDPTDVFWGERFSRVGDPFGHEWGFTTRLHEMSPDKIQAVAEQMLSSSPNIS